MSNRYRHRIEYEKPRMFPVASATVIEIGDMLWLDPSTSKVKPASDFTWDTNLGTTQQGFSLRFVGIARSASASGETDDVRVGTDSVFEMDCASNTFSMLERLAPAKNASANELEDQKVVKTTKRIRQIGVVAEEVAAASTSVLMELKKYPLQHTTTTTAP